MIPTTGFRVMTRGNGPTINNFRAGAPDPGDEWGIASFESSKLTAGQVNLPVVNTGPFDAAQVRGVFRIRIRLRVVFFDDQLAAGFWQQQIRRCRRNLA